MIKKLKDIIEIEWKDNTKCSLSFNMLNKGYQGQYGIHLVSKSGLVVSDGESKGDYKIYRESGNGIEYCKSPENVNGYFSNEKIQSFNN
jgi:hypothetical protein